MKKIINKQHAQWITYWTSPIQFTTVTPQVNEFWFEIEDVLQEWPNYQCAWLLIDKQGGQYVIAKESNGRFGTYISGGHGGEPMSFDTLEDAATITFAEWFPEGSKGEWNDDINEYCVDGEWLIREVQE